jgi:hypothetical protein
VRRDMRRNGVGRSKIVGRRRKRDMILNSELGRLGGYLCVMWWIERKKDEVVVGSVEVRERHITRHRCV